MLTNSVTKWEVISYTLLGSIPKLKKKLFISKQTNKTHRAKNKQFLSVKLRIIPYPLVLTFVLGAQKNRLIETILLITHNICLVDEYENKF